MPHSHAVRRPANRPRPLLRRAHPARVRRRHALEAARPAPQPPVVAVAAPRRQPKTWINGFPLAIVLSVPIWAAIFSPLWAF